MVKEKSVKFYVNKSVYLFNAKSIFDLVSAWKNYNKPFITNQQNLRLYYYFCLKLTWDKKVVLILMYKAKIISSIFFSIMGSFHILSLTV